MRRAMWIALGALLCFACAPQDPVQVQARQLGIEVLGVQRMADGDVARLNYRVVDYERAKRSLRGQVALLREGAASPLGVLSAGRLGPLRQRPTRGGRRQFMLFMDPGRTLHGGDRVILTIGDARITGIPVS